jgi:hypothetical protein
MLAFKSSLVAEISYYDESVYDVNRLMSELYYEYPDAAFGMPKVAVSFYPDKGFTRIMDIALTYPQSPIVLVSEAKQLNEFARTVSSDVSELSPYDKIVYFYEYLQKNVKPDESSMRLSDVHGDSYKKTESSTAYGALVIKSAMPEGYAFALKKLCELSDIECTVVPGRYGDRSHYWNIVKLGSGYYHIDASMGLFEAQQGQAVCLLADSAMPQQYRWDSEKYPKCTANEYIYPSPPPSPSPGPGEKAGESPSPSPKGKGG